MSGEDKTFAGLPVVFFDPDKRKTVTPGRAWELHWWPDDEDLRALLEQFCGTPGAGQVSGLVLDGWGYLGDGEQLPVEPLAAVAERLPNLTAVRLGDGPYLMSSEIMVMTQGDVTPLLRAYPRLEVLQVYGSLGLGLAPLRHEALRELTFESAGLPADVVRAVGVSDLPALEHLELWLGAAQYGDTTVDDLAPILTGARLPRLTTLGLRAADLADQIAQEFAGASVVAQLHTLDLSLGTLTDRGGEALLAGQPLTHLKKLDLHFHYLSDEMAARLVAELPGTDVDVSDPQPDYGDGERFVAAGE